jgi:hypothetical protein
MNPQSKEWKCSRAGAYARLAKTTRNPISEYMGYWHINRCSTVIVGFSPRYSHLLWKTIIQMGLQVVYFDWGSGSISAMGFQVDFSGWGFMYETLDGVLSR